jgi:hypothetical protein
VIPDGVCQPLVAGCVSAAMATQHKRPENMGKTANQHRNTRLAGVWGHQDNEIQPIPDGVTVEEAVDRYLASFPASHWRPIAGKILRQPYTILTREGKKVGMLVREPTGTGKVNLIMHKDDPLGSIYSIQALLKGHPIVCRGATGLEVMQHVGYKNEAVKDKTGDHASPFNIVFRTVKLHSYTIGFTKNGDLTNTKGETGLRHAWIETLGMPDCGSEILEEMVNLLCLLVGHEPPYPDQLGGKIKLYVPAQRWGSIGAVPGQLALGTYNRQLRTFTRNHDYPSTPAEFHRQPLVPSDSATAVGTATATFAAELTDRLVGAAKRVQESVATLVIKTATFYQDSGMVHVETRGGARYVKSAEQTIEDLEQVATAEEIRAAVQFHGDNLDRVGDAGAASQTQPLVGSPGSLHLEIPGVGETNASSRRCHWCQKLDAYADGGFYHRECICRCRFCQRSVHSAPNPSCQCLFPGDPGDPFRPPHGKAAPMKAAPLEAAPKPAPPPLRQAELTVKAPPSQPKAQLSGPRDIPLGATIGVPQWHGGSGPIPRPPALKDERQAHSDRAHASVHVAWEKKRMCLCGHCQTRLW